MGKNSTDVKGYLLALGRQFADEDGDVLRVAPSSEDHPPVMVAVRETVVFSVRIGPVPQERGARLQLCERLLSYNATDLAFCAYGIDDEQIVLSAAQEVENLYANEVQAILDDMELALTGQVPTLRQICLASEGETGLDRPLPLGFSSSKDQEPTMGVFSRLAQLIKANLNELISKSEDPEKMLNQVVLEMNGQLITAKKQVALAIADEKKLARQVQEEQKRASEWERRAMLAIRKGDDHLAKEALNRKKEHDKLTAAYNETWQKQKASADQLKLALRRLNDKIEEAKRKKNVLIARKKRAEAQKAIHETMSGLKDQSAFETFARMEERIDRIEAEAEAGVELSEEYSGDSLAQKFRDMEMDSGADEDLLALKRQMGLEPPAPAEPSPMRVSPQPIAAPPVAAGASETSNLSPEEEDELAAALAEIEAEEARERERLKR